ncbi:MAG TPA: ATP-binding cassette domain-containing protein [Petrotogaceae bacterium]|nr:ATP-binding cassette domain-containing protein [Petrotogaceae bacterium]HQH32083.1 ATP-binding cassette domain-containing protein [Petrotogaceae bacterium]HQI78156.1 ATP-binding cassette domain-containing protein [Petrotogaceae bacterium]
MLEIKDISYCAGNRKILNNVSFTFKKDKTYAILGNNGVGKSTLARIIMGTEGYRNIHTGKIFFEGKDISELKVDQRARSGITMIWQEPARFEGISVRDYLTLGGKENLSDESILKTLSSVGLNHFYLFRKVDKTLSGGERKRIELASVMIIKPKVVILDEPDSGIDMMSNSMILNVIDFLRSNGSTVISITHREEIAMLSDEALLLCAGEIYAYGSPQSVSKSYKDMCDSCSHINIPLSQ